MSFAANPTFIMDEARILATLSYMEGGAATTFADLYYGNNMQWGMLVVGTWHNFINSLTSIFGDLQLALTAQMEIWNMHLNPNSQDLMSFFMTFSLKAAYTGRPTSSCANDTVNNNPGQPQIRW